MKRMKENKAGEGNSEVYQCNSLLVIGENFVKKIRFQKTKQTNRQTKKTTSKQTKTKQTKRNCNGDSVLSALYMARDSKPCAHGRDSTSKQKSKFSSYL